MKRIKPHKYFLKFFNSNSRLVCEHKQVKGSKANSIIQEKELSINDEPISKSFGAILPPEFADLIDVAMAVYLADRISPRQKDRRQDPYDRQWKRQFKIELPLRQPKQWSNSVVKSKLEAVLNYFTDDQWDFSFKEISSLGRPSERQSHLFSNNLPSPKIASLFSGGLDSLAGTCTMLKRNPDCTFILFSASTNNRFAAIQKELRKSLQHHFNNKIIHITVPFNLKRGKGDDFDEEKTQRSRGFVYLSIGAITAIMAHIDKLYIYENGIGALNLPCNRAQWGTYNTRAVHPLSLEKMGDFISSLFGSSFDFVNPFLFYTKAQMCEILSENRLEYLAKKSVSCDSFPLRDKKADQCGFCTSCILRRQALSCSGLSKFDPSGRYKINICNSNKVINDDNKFHLSMMLSQINKIKECLCLPEPWKELAKVFPQLEEIKISMRNPTSKNEYSIESSFVKLFQSYVLEWAKFPFKDNSLWFKEKNLSKEYSTELEILQDKGE